MKLLVKATDLNTYKSRDLIPLECYTCSSTFKREKHDIQKVLKNSKNLSLKFCSRECSYQNKSTKREIECDFCFQSFSRMPHDIKDNNFCSRSCANKHRIIPKIPTKKRMRLQQITCLKCPKTLSWGNKTGMCKTCYLKSDLAMEQRGRTFSKHRKYKINPSTQEKFYLMSSLEEKFFDLCVRHDIEFQKPQTLHYLGNDGKQHNYFPDFFLPHEGFVVEIKGFLTKEDKIKLHLVALQHPKTKLKLVFKHQIESFIDKILATRSVTAKNHVEVS